MEQETVKLVRGLELETAELAPDQETAEPELVATAEALVAVMAEEAEMEEAVMEEAVMEENDP